MAKDCPDKPAEVCRNCQQEGKYSHAPFLIRKSLNQSD